jgi:hypothetical protein
MPTTDTMVTVTRGMDTLITQITTITIMLVTTITTVTITVMDMAIGGTVTGGLMA